MIIYIQLLGSADAVSAITARGLSAFRPLESQPQFVKLARFIRHELGKTTADEKGP